MKKIIALTVFALLAFAPAARSEAAMTTELRATDFSSVKEVDPAPQGKLKGSSAAHPDLMAGRKKKGGLSSGAEEVGFNPQPDPPGIDKKKFGKKTFGTADKGAETSGPSPHMNSPRMDMPRFSVPSLGGAGGARVR